MNTTTARADLAKSLITVCAQDSTGKTCSAAHCWAALGLQPRIMAAEFVQPYRKSRAGKNDRNDAEAIAIAVRDANAD